MSFIKKILPKAPPAKTGAVPVNMPTSKGANTLKAKKLKTKKP